MDKNIKAHKRLILDCSDGFHAEVKERAAKKKMRIKEWMYYSLVETIRREKLDEQDKTKTQI